MAGNPWIWWFGAAVLLGFIETVTGDLTAGMLAVGALVGMVVAFVLPGMFPVQAVAAAVVAVAMLVFLRPGLRRRFNESPGFRSSVSIDQGSQGVALSPVTGTGGVIRSNGETWSARSFDPAVVIDEGKPVVVLDMDGLTALVHPYDELMP